MGTTTTTSTIQRHLQHLWTNDSTTTTTTTTTTGTKTEPNIKIHTHYHNLTASHPVHCSNTTYCCGQWTINADKWWLHHPHWEVVLEDDNQFCFAPFDRPVLLHARQHGRGTQQSLLDTARTNQHRAQVLERLHWQQWRVNISTTTTTVANNSNNQEEEEDTPSSLVQLAAILPDDHHFTVNCSDLVTAHPISSGYGASLQFVYAPFWFAYTRRRPFQITKRSSWLYTADADPANNHTTKWAHCEDKDMACLFLPVSPCSRIQPEQPRIARRPPTDDPNQVLEWLWMRDYMTRPKQDMRYRLMKLRRPYEDQLSSLSSPQGGEKKNKTNDDEDDDGGCIAVHVRRGDAGLPRGFSRRYAAVKEYLDLLPTTWRNSTSNTTTKTIFLLTDDQSTIDEVKQRYIDNNNSSSSAHRYRWVYTNKTRVRGTELGFEGLIPVGSNGPLELLYITVELDLAARYCTTLVHGQSGYASLLYHRMLVANRGVPPRRYELNTKLDRGQVVGFQGQPHRRREKHLLQQVDAVYDES